MFIRNHPTDGLKGQKIIAQGNALGIFEHTSSRALKGQKLLIIMLLTLSYLVATLQNEQALLLSLLQDLPFQGESYYCRLYPGRCPGLYACCPFGAPSGDCG